MKHDKPAAVESQKPASPAPRPLKPRRKMFLILLSVWVLWVAFLLTMYFTTVYPHRYIEADPEPSAQASSPNLSRSLS